jgi:Asp/Glu/hydantoin racemase
MGRTISEGGMSSILVINPNSSISDTEKLKDIADPAPDFTYKFFTSPRGPAVIDSYTDEALSVGPCLESLMPVLDQHDAFLIVSYSDHPLIPILREQTDKPVMGTFQASILQALAFGRGKFAVLTSSSGWKHRLEEAVVSLIGTHSQYVGTYSADFTDLPRTSDPEKHRDIIQERVCETASRAVTDGARYLLLGSMELLGMDDIIQEQIPGIHVIDGVVAGTEMLVGLVRSIS